MTESNRQQSSAYPQLTVAIIAIEPSADLHGSNLAKALLAINPNLKLVGVGGSHMAASGVNLWLKTTDMAVIGPGGAISRLHKYIYHYLYVRSHLLKEHPHLSILIDCPAVNMRYAGLLTRYGYHSVYYFPPSAWTTSEARLRQIFSRTDKVICTFLSNAENYRRFGMDVDFFGHPLIDIPELAISAEEAKSKLGLVGDNILAVLPGSRAPEIKYLLPVFLQIAAELRKEIEDLQVLIPCATQALRRQIVAFMGDRFPYVRVLDGESRLALLSCRAALMSSGTASLEAAILGTPMVLSYKLCPFDAVIGRFLLWSGLLKIEHIGLPSLVVGRRIVPEFLQDEVSPENILPHLRNFMRDTPERRQVKQELLDMRNSMGAPGVVAKIASSLYRRIESNAAERQAEPFDIVITSNSPGEVAAWVRRTTTQLEARNNGQFRVIVALVPCPYASGAEAEVAAALPGVSVVLTPSQTLRLMGGFFKDFQFRRRGVVVFLGGDLIHAKILSWRLKYRSIAYAARYNQLISYFDKVAASDVSLAEELSEAGVREVVTIGNLSVDGVLSEVDREAAGSLQKRKGVKIGIFPGSRFLHTKIALGVFLRVAALIKTCHPEVEFVLSVSPFVSKARLESALYSPFSLGLPVAKGKFVSSDRIEVECLHEAENAAGRNFEVEVLWGHPYQAIAEIDMALTIPGTNTGELGCCGKPMVIGLSADASLPRGGLGGLLEQIPILSKLKRRLRLRSYERHGFAAIPNRIASRVVVPEILVKKDTSVLAQPILDWIENPEKCARVSQDLKDTMKTTEGAGERMADLILSLVDSK
ncbi:MAG: lipid-A-disaccharide synthase [Candidatus Bruticola sp.]